MGSGHYIRNGGKKNTERKLVNLLLFNCLLPHSFVSLFIYTYILNFLIIKDSLLVDGVAFKKTFSYAGFEQQPKSFKTPKILSLNIELELKAEKDNAEVRIEDVSVRIKSSAYLKIVILL